MGRWQWSQETSGKHRAGTKQSAHLPCRTPWTSFAGIPANATQRLRTRSTRFSYRVGPQQLAQPLRDEALQHVSKGSLHPICPGSQWTQLHPHTGRSGLNVCDPSGSLQYNPLQLSSRWNWSAGCLWEYSQPVNVNNAIQAVHSGDQTVMTILCQGIC